MSDSLRDALEELVRDRSSDRGAVPGDYVIAPYELSELLAAHPVEPADERECLATRTLGITPHVCLLHPGHESDHQWTADREHPAEPVGVSDDARTSGLIDCGGTGHEFEAEVADCRTCGSSGVSDEAVVAARIAFYEHPASHGMNSKAQDRAIRAALEAAQPFMGATPVASRERMVEVLVGLLQEANKRDVAALERQGWPGIPEVSTDSMRAHCGHLVDALLAAGVFIEPPTREQALSAIGDTLNRRIEYIEDHATVQSAYEAATDAVLHLMGGAS